MSDGHRHPQKVHKVLLPHHAKAKLFIQSNLELATLAYLSYLSIGRKMKPLSHLMCAQCTSVNSTRHGTIPIRSCDLCCIKEPTD